MNNTISLKAEDGYSMTLTTIALKYLDEAEATFGPRTTDYIYGGVEIVQENRPLFWFPFNKYVVIRVTPTTITDQKDAIFQIAHEVIHLLSPTSGPTTTNLEEGLAVWFSLKVAERDGEEPERPILVNTLGRYRHSYTLVSQLLAMQPDAIVALRKIQPVLGHITTDDFLQAKIDIPVELTTELVKQMEY